MSIQFKVMSILFRLAEYKKRSGNPYFTLSYKNCPYVDYHWLGLLLAGHLRINFYEICTNMQQFSYKNIDLKMLVVLSGPQVINPNSSLSL